ncbi:hypothetical protein TGME49_282020 [Toxoplasma gondii ME49]|uniref:Transmembrane protein n=1 Tax=Toxoplasma gondii (strain ATCC 50611 / Me49) TaxID=508771 RepID=S8GEW9_TOXGM|nr:hypothetical protein TGME49_282020 [Toxoplasma gondii ME49]EPT30365.1 hypothetical protein TGME49_282020 [Toxoplasma gondii ME49]|eukprot:XP_002371411.1 hypothetical protein TGME49_282020 [Toxoplasma gondii ME49]
MKLTFLPEAHNVPDCGVAHPGHLPVEALAGQERETEIQAKGEQTNYRLLTTMLACVVLSSICFCCFTVFVIWSCAYQSPILGVQWSNAHDASYVGNGDATRSSEILNSTGYRDEGEVHSSVSSSPFTPLETGPRPFVSIWEINTIPLFAVQNMGALSLRWGDDSTLKMTEMILQVTGISRSGSDLNSIGTNNVGATTIFLAGGSTFVVEGERAVLYNSDGNVVKSMTKVVNPSQDRDEGRNIPPEEEGTIQFLGVRRLEQKPGGIFGKPKQTGFAPAMLPNGPPPQPLGPPASFMDAYCRYGCGGMSVTFPYYYRPFFGYGYPLVGTEAMFPQGYGGYPAAPLLASQGGASAIMGASGPVLAGGVPATALGVPGMGAANVVGGVQPVAVALPLR